VGGEHTSDHQGSYIAVSQQVMGCEISTDKGNCKSENAKPNTFEFVFAETVDVNFQGHQKHQVQQAGGREQLQTRFFADQMQPVRADGNAGYYQPKNGWHADSLADRRNYQHNEQAKRQHNDRTFYGKKHFIKSSYVPLPKLDNFFEKSNFF
jgi:hypothetical protein